jgi:hypothetical protein
MPEFKCTCSPLASEPEMPFGIDREKFKAADPFMCAEIPLPTTPPIIPNRDNNGSQVAGERLKPQDRERLESIRHDLALLKSASPFTLRPRAIHDDMVWMLALIEELLTIQEQTNEGET